MNQCGVKFSDVQSMQWYSKSIQSITIDVLDFTINKICVQQINSMFCEINVIDKKSNDIRSEYTTKLRIYFIVGVQRNLESISLWAYKSDYGDGYIHKNMKF